MPSCPPVIEIVVEERGVEEQGGGQGHQGQAQARQAEREERQHDRHAAANGRTDQAADEQVEAEVVGQLGRREGADPGQASPGTARAGPPCR